MLYINNDDIKDIYSKVINELNFERRVFLELGRDPCLNCFCYGFPCDNHKKKIHSANVYFAEIESLFNKNKKIITISPIKLLSNTYVKYTSKKNKNKLCLYNENTPYKKFNKYTKIYNNIVKELKFLRPVFYISRNNEISPCIYCYFLGFYNCNFYTTHLNNNDTFGITTYSSIEYCLSLITDNNIITYSSLLSLIIIIENRGFYNKIIKNLSFLKMKKCLKPKKFYYNLFNQSIEKFKFKRIVTIYKQNKLIPCLNCYEYNTLCLFHCLSNSLKKIYYIDYISYNIIENLYYNINGIVHISPLYNLQWANTSQFEKKNNTLSFIKNDTLSSLKDNNRKILNKISI